MFPRFSVALKATLSTLIVDGKHRVFQELGRSESYRKFALKFYRIFVAVKATVFMTINCHC